MVVTEMNECCLNSSRLTVSILKEKLIELQSKISDGEALKEINKMISELQSQNKTPPTSHLS